MSSLLDRWQSALPVGAPADCVAATFVDLLRRYGEPGRYYHTLLHLLSVLDTIESLWPEPPGSLLLAGCLHDVVYDSRAADNEVRSAEYARTKLPELLVSPEEIEETCRLILLTRTHEVSEADRPGQVLLDADLAILGAAPIDYATYAEGIRLEYAWVPVTDYRAGRRQVLQRFLARPRIYATADLFNRCEAKARYNLAREIESLSR